MDPLLVSELKRYILEVVAAGGIFVAGLTSWLGAITSARILRKEEARQRLKADLYREAAEPFIALFVETKFAQTTTLEKIAAFETARLRVSARLALFAPQAVIDEFDALADHTFDALEGGHVPTESDIVKLGFSFLNAARTDIGLASGRVAYRGHRLPRTTNSNELNTTTRS